MLARGQESMFHIAAGSQPVQAAGGSQNRGPKNEFIQPKGYMDEFFTLELLDIGDYKNTNASNFFLYRGRDSRSKESVGVQAK